jgi:hypothetical protein
MRQPSSGWHSCSFAHMTNAGEKNDADLMKRRLVGREDD